MPLSSVRHQGTDFAEILREFCLETKIRVGDVPAENAAPWAPTGALPVVQAGAVTADSIDKDFEAFTLAADLVEC